MKPTCRTFYEDPSTAQEATCVQSLVLYNCMKWGSPDAPAWTIEEAMQVMSLLGKPFRENGYCLALHGSVPEQGKGNDLDLLAVPADLTATPPEEMEHLMCALLHASPFEEPRRGLLRTWSRACILEDGRQIDMQYRLPLPLDWQGATRPASTSTFAECVSGAEKINTRIGELLSRRYTDERRLTLALAYLNLCLDHHRGIAVLMRTQLYGPALALVRVIFEAMIKAHWVAKCASDAQVDDIAEHDSARFPNMYEMTKAIDKALSDPNDATPTFFQQAKNDAWKATNSYTHSGLSIVVPGFQTRQ